ncbi:transcription factor subunit Med10 of mediator complex-domain-containing protein [Entophlyctis helioformis]|nr:transcription factor subunit Med10 of mediator complex-domain-containing protein [Entophlyctis helioformis]
MSTTAEAPATATTATTATTAAAGSTEQLEATLLDTLDVLLKMGMTVYDYQPESADVLGRRINKLTACLAGLDDLKHQASDVHIPMALLDVVEAGANPDLFLRDLVQTLTDKNQKSNGRVQSIRMLRQEMEAQVLRNYASRQPLHDHQHQHQHHDLPGTQQ